MAGPYLECGNKPTLLLSLCFRFFWLAFQQPIGIPAELWGDDIRMKKTAFVLMELTTYWERQIYKQMILMWHVL